MRYEIPNPMGSPSQAKERLIDVFRWEEIRNLTFTKWRRDTFIYFEIHGLRELDRDTMERILNAEFVIDGVVYEFSSMQAGQETLGEGLLETTVYWQELTYAQKVR